jgi:hypothetical protein
VALPSHKKRIFDLFTEMSKQNEQIEKKNTYSKTGRFENPEELQLHQAT